MPYRAWVYAAAFGLAVSASGQAQEQAPYPNGEAATQEQPAQPLPIPLPIDVIEDEAAAKARERQEQETREREIADLAAQVGMNDAAQAMNEATQRMAKYALWSTLLVGVGTVLLIATLYLTRQANRAAQAAVDVTREIGMAQVRAYMVLEPEVRWVNHPINKNDIWVDLVIKGFNRGQTPAKITGRFGYARRLGTEEEGFDPIPFRTAMPISDAQCGPGLSVPIFVGNLQGEILATAISDQTPVITHVRVEYLDVFKKSRFVEATFSHIIHEIPPGEDRERIGAAVTTRTYPKGNDSN